MTQLDDEEAEAEHIAREILRAERYGHAARGHFAVLFRTQVQPRVFEARFRAHGIPYTLVGGPSFFDRKEVRDVLAYLKLVANEDDEVSLLRVINTPPRGVGKSSIDRVLAFATEHGISAPRAWKRSGDVDGLAPKAAAAVAAFQADLAVLGRSEPGQRLVAMVKQLLDVTRYRDEIDRCYPDTLTRETRWAAVTEVVNFAENYVKRAGSEATLAGFLEELTLTANDDKTSEDGERRNAVTLMTLHAAKGLEFPRVYLVGCEEGILPHARSVKEDTVEEERRLMYVGVTRARRNLTLTHARTRAKFGKRVETSPSRFLFEIDGKPPPAGWRPAGSPDREIERKGKKKRRGRPRPPGAPRRRTPRR